MSKKKNDPARGSRFQDAKKSPGGEQFHAFRETIESVVIAFVLAFLFRTFEAEAFVIPTGSMSPSLQGQHKDVECDQCGHRFRASASEEGEKTANLMAELRNPRLRPEEREQIRNRILDIQVVGGMCPMCRYTMPMRPDIDLASDTRDAVNLEQTSSEISYPGDRILVNKYGFSFHEPERWDVVVFKFPGNGNMNYIKRLVGLPNESLQIYHGDLFVNSANGTDDFQIESKPPHKVRAMLQEVHDTDFDPSNLYRAGWPLRWASDDGWNVEADASDTTVDQTYAVDASDGDDWQWLRYRHLLPNQTLWEKVLLSDGDDAALASELNEAAEPALVTDFNPYNARIQRGQISRNRPWQVFPFHQGMHWVGDLAIRCEAEVTDGGGELALDLVEAGMHLRGVIDLDTGQVTFHAIDAKTGESTDLGISGNTPVDGPGNYELLFANVDDQLLLWVDDHLIDLGDSRYDPERLFGSRDAMLPWTSDDNPGDLAPVGVGARGAVLEITRLEVLRDIYYIAVKTPDPGEPGGRSRTINVNADYTDLSEYVTLEDGTRLPPIRNPQALFVDSDLWGRFQTRQAVDFQTEEEQYFVLGDNSPESEDCRLWNRTHPETGAKPGGAYLDRRLLIGEAVCVFWPHGWGNWFGIPILNKLPGFPAFGDMRLVR